MRTTIAALFVLLSSGAGVAAAADGHRFARDPIVVVGQDSTNGRSAVIYARMTRRFSSPGRYLLEGRADLHPPFVLPGWPRCYYQVIAESLARNVEVGARVRITAALKNRVQDRANVVVRRGRGLARDTDKGEVRRRFRQLGCRAR